MSWFDTTGFASIAKTALKEAQRTIDKALDIKDESTITTTTSAPVDTNSEDFFSSWGVAPTGADAKKAKPKSEDADLSRTKSSIWGSFTGSFFDAATPSIATHSFASDRSGSIEGLDDSADPGEERFTESKLVVQPSDPNSDGQQVEDTSTRSGVNEQLQSPDSIEVIHSDSCQTTPESDRISTASIEVLSSLASPSSIEVISKSTECLETPDSIEIIPEDSDDRSQEDSVSECTQNTSYETVSARSKSSAISGVDLQADGDGGMKEVPITRAPSRCGLHLPLHSAHVTNVIDIPQVCQSTNLSDTEDSSVTLTTSGENLMESSSDTSTATDSTASSMYLKSMLADAMHEKREPPEIQLMDLTQSMLGESSDGSLLQDLSISQLDMPPREASPLSSESRSDLVKVGSDQTSGHTSGDEIETTTTSSDIEVISSPNGDSSSTQSRHSPMKQAVGKAAKSDGQIDVLLSKMTMKKMMEHHRDLSEASSISEECEIDRLLKHLAEVSEILEIRESKLVETSRKLSEVQELNVDLQQQLDMFANQQVHSADMSQVTEKYAQRLSALEKKFQQAIREKDVLRKQLDQCREDNATRMSRSEMDGILEEKDQTIKELREEGEKLSKQQLQHSNIIKKLRAKEKEHEQTIKHLKESVEDLSSETERLKRSHSAKEEVERSQIEAIHQLTAMNKRTKYELEQVQGNYDDLVEKHSTMKKSLAAAKKELVDKNRASTELQQREQLLQTLESSKRLTESQNEEILNQLEDMRLKVRKSDEDSLSKAQKFRAENAELMRLLENAESRNEELSQSILETSKPLVRQLESLQAAHNMRVMNFEKIEQDLNLKINQLQSKLQNTLESSKSIKDENAMFKSRLSSIQANVEVINRENEQLRMKIDQLTTEQMMKKQDYSIEIDDLKEQLALETKKTASQQLEIESLHYNMNVERSNHEKEMAKVGGNVGKSNHSSPDLVAANPSRHSHSPTNSIERVSIAESTASSFWPDENIGINAVSRCTNMLEMQVLQTNLKQRDGDVQQLQWELNRREHERTLLNTEISQLISKVEDMEVRTSKLSSVERELAELKQQYETLCQLFGEKVEENEELKMDLVDVKDMYKAQIDELLQQSGSCL